MRVVIDTGVLVSALIQRQGTTGAVLRALRDGRFTVIYTSPILEEVIDVLGRPQIYKKYHIEPEDIRALIDLVRLRGELVVINRRVKICRDPEDDKFLDAALAGEVDFVVSGDFDLIELSPFEGIPILRPAAFLAELK